MHGEGFFTPMKIVSYVVLGAMIAAILWGVWISYTHWTGIGV